MPGAIETAADVAAVQPGIDAGDPLGRWRASVEGIVGLPFTEGNRVDRLRNGTEIFPAMLDAIAEAERTIDFLTFIYWTGDIAHRAAHALAAKAAQGVRVRVLLDAVGARFMSPALKRHLRDAGAQVELFRPPTTWKLWEMGHRTHRKLLVCDENVAFTGGVGIAKEWEGNGDEPGHWRDSHFRIRGPAVNGLRAAFLGNWIETGHHLVDDRDRFPDQPQVGSSLAMVVRARSGHGWNDAALTMEAILHCAQERIRLATAYFTPDEALAEDIAAAVDRGVEVEIIIPGPHADKRVMDIAALDSCCRLAEVGACVQRYQPTMFHTKAITVDGVLSVVGSVNLNSRSMRHDDEVAVVVLDPAFTSVLDGDFDDDLEHSLPLEDGDWASPGPLQRVGNRITRVIDDLL